MKKNRLQKALVVLVLGILAVSLFAFAGCGGGNKGQGTLSAETIEETGAFKVTADDAAKDAGLVVSGAVTLEEGDILLVSPDLTSGKLHVKVLDESNNAVFDEDVDGRILDTYDIGAGEYSIAVDCIQDGTTGSLVIAANNAEEFDQQSQDLEEALAKGNVK